MFALFLNAILSTLWGMILMFLHRCADGSNADPAAGLVVCVVVVGGRPFHQLLFVSTRNRQPSRCDKTGDQFRGASVCVGDHDDLHRTEFAVHEQYLASVAIRMLRRNRSVGRPVRSVYIFSGTLEHFLLGPGKRMPKRHSPGDRPWRVLGEHIFRRRDAWTIVLCAFTISCAIGLPRVQISNQLSDQFPHRLESVATQSGLKIILVRRSRSKSWSVSPRTIQSVCSIVFS